MTCSVCREDLLEQITERRGCNFKRQIALFLTYMTCFIGGKIYLDTNFGWYTLDLELPMLMSED